MRRFSWLALLVFAGCGHAEPVANPAVAELKKLPPGIHKLTAEVPGVGVVNYTIEVPETYDGKTPVPLILALHYGYEGAKPAPYTGAVLLRVLGPGLGSLKAIVIAPDVVDGDWTDTKNETAAVWLTKAVIKTYAIDPKRIVITGFSMGGEGTWFIGSRHQDLFTGAIPIAAPVAASDATWKIPVYVIHSDADETVSYEGANEHANDIKKKGATLEFRTAKGLTHQDTGAYADTLPDALKWLQSKWK